MSKHRLVIAGTGSGVGKTTITIGLMAALKNMGLTVQGFKCGPDYIDPSYHTAITGRQSRNLDSWMLSHQTVREIYARGSEGADISIIEGVMGFYDGKNPKTNEGTTAEISSIIESPVLLVVNCQSMARSVAAIVKGFQCFAEGINIIGVIANKVGSVGHFKIVQEAVESECNIPVLGYLTRDEQLKIPERHLGLIPSVERGELTPFFQKLAEQISASFDINRLLELSKVQPLQIEPRLFSNKQENTLVRIAVARDAAFNFYYPENIELLESYGAECVFFSPLKGDKLPENTDGLYLGGGFPEEFAETLSRQHIVNESIAQAIQNGLPTFAECGGFMYLTEAIIDTSGNRYPMVGLIPGQVRMQEKLAALGYREIFGNSENFLLENNLRARGHEFHYSTFFSEKEIQHAYETKGLRGYKKEGYTNWNLVAGYTHIHFASNPVIAQKWIEKCLQFRKENGGSYFYE